MAFILKKKILASKLVTKGTKTVPGQKIQIAAGLAIEMGDDVPGATSIVINFNGEKYVTNKSLLKKAI